MLPPSPSECEGPGEQQEVERDPVFVARDNIETLRRNVRERKFLAVLGIPLLAACVADVVGAFKDLERQPWWPAHQVLVYGCTAAAAFWFFYRGKNVRFAEEGLQALADRGDLEGAIRQLWRENPDQQAALQQIAERYHVSLPEWLDHTLPE